MRLLSIIALYDGAYSEKIRNLSRKHRVVIGENNEPIIIEYSGTNHARIIDKPSSVNLGLLFSEQPIRQCIVFPPQEKEFSEFLPAIHLFSEQTGRNIAMLRVKSGEIILLDSDLLDVLMYQNDEVVGKYLIRGDTLINADTKSPEHGEEVNGKVLTPRDILKHYAAMPQDDGIPWLDDENWTFNFTLMFSANVEVLNAMFEGESGVKSRAIE